ncbi:MAG: hypothetical protein Q9213_008128 [Squamulea squamosa]
MPLEWVDAFETVDLDIGPSDPASTLVHLHRRQKFNSKSDSAPSSGSQSRTRPITSTLLGNILPKQRYASASDDNLSIGCEPACSIDGSAEVTKGTFKLKRKRDGFDISEASIQAVVHRLEATVPFHVMLREPREMNLEIPLVPEWIPFLPIELEGLLSIGPSMTVVLGLSFNNTEPVDLSYGFNASIPLGSSMNLRLGDLQSSSITGLYRSPFPPPFADHPHPWSPDPIYQHQLSDDIAVEPLSFRSTTGTEIPNLKFSVALRPRLFFGIKVIGGALVDVGVEAFIDLHKLNVAIGSQPDTTGGQCVAAEPSNSGMARQANERTKRLTHVTTSLEVDAVVGLNDKLPF